MGFTAVHISDKTKEELDKTKRVTNMSYSSIVKFGAVLVRQHIGFTAKDDADAIANMEHDQKIQSYLYDKDLRYRLKKSFMQQIKKLNTVELYDYFLLLVAKAETNNISRKELLDEILRSMKNNDKLIQLKNKLIQDGWLQRAIQETPDIEISDVDVYLEKF